MTQRRAATVLTTAAVLVLGLCQASLAYLHPQAGRFLQRDPLGYVDGGNLYWYVGAEPVANVDPSGEDYIAVADRAVSGSGGLFYHYSIQYRDSCVGFSPSQPVEVEIFDRIDPVLASIELLQESWNIWEIVQGPFGTRLTINDVGVSVVYYSDSADRLMIGVTPAHWSDERVSEAWDRVVSAAQTYAYAEQPGATVAANWPNSYYEMLNDIPIFRVGNNSNTFVREMVRAAGGQMRELPGSHPGRTSPRPVRHEWRWRSLPWPDGAQAQPRP